MEYRATFSIGSILSPDTPTMSFNEPPADGQTKADSAAASLVITFYLIKAIEDTFGEMWRNALSIIAYMQGKSSSFFRLLMLIGS